MGRPIVAEVGVEIGRSVGAEPLDDIAELGVVACSDFVEPVREFFRPERLPEPLIISS